MKDGYPDLMVVDDEPAVRGLMAGVLRMKGYRPRTASHGVEALEMSLLRQGPPDLIVTDVIMPPHFNGVELVRKLRVLKPEMKALYVSAYAADNEVSQAFGEPLSDFLPKPLAPVLLSQTVERMLDGTPGAAARDARRRKGTVMTMISEPSRRSRIRDALFAGGLWILEAQDPTEAQGIGKWNEGPIHVLLMDVPQVPGKGGWLRRLQSSRPDLRVVFVEEAEEGYRFTPEAFAGETDGPWPTVRGLLEASPLAAFRVR